MFTQESFCNAVWGTTYLKVQHSYDKSDYTTFSIPKKDGFRELNYLPKSSKLFSLQQELLHNLLDHTYLPTCAKGFRRGESYKSYLAPHVGSQYFLRVDIKDFFPSINEERIKSELERYIAFSSKDEAAAIIELITDIVTYNGSLPQGASTSPAISNIVLARVDQRILKYCQVFGITYTRYADDLLFSSLNFDFSQKPWFLKKIRHILRSINLKINYSKIKYGTKEISLNGYVISCTETRLSRKRLSDIRHVLSTMQQNASILATSGEESFLKAINSLSLQHRDLTRYPFNSLFLLLQYLSGYRAFLISWIDTNNRTSSFQKELSHLIGRIEKTIIQFT